MREWLRFVEWHKPMYEGDDRLSVISWDSREEAVYSARHMGCCAGVIAVWVAPTSDPEHWVERWDKRHCNCWIVRP